MTAINTKRKQLTVPIEPCTLDEIKAARFLHAGHDSGHPQNGETLVPVSPDGRSSRELVAICRFAAFALVAKRYGWGCAFCAGDPFLLAAATAPLDAADEDGFNPHVLGERVTRIAQAGRFFGGRA